MADQPDSLVTIASFATSADASLARGLQTTAYMSTLKSSLLRLKRFWKDESLLTPNDERYMKGAMTARGKSNL
jgi:hypothetical protein